MGGASLVVGAGLLALFSHELAILFASAALSAWAMAPIFPTAFGLVNARYAATAGAGAGLIIFGGTLGGAVLPYSIGQVLAGAGVPGAAGLIAVIAVLIVGLQLLLTWGVRPRPARVPALDSATCSARRVEARNQERAKGAKERAKGLAFGGQPLSVAFVTPSVVGYRPVTTKRPPSLRPNTSGE